MYITEGREVEVLAYEIAVFTNWWVHGIDEDIAERILNELRERQREILGEHREVDKG